MIFIYLLQQIYYFENITIDKKKIIDSKCNENDINKHNQQNRKYRRIDIT